MKKTSTIGLMAITTLFMLGGCGEPILSNKQAQTSKSYDHTSTIINTSYTQASRNLKKGLMMCAENVRTPSLVRTSGVTVMPGDSYYHVLGKKNGRLEYNLRWFMGGVIEGDCAVCQPKGGFYSIYATVERAKGFKAKLRTHTYFKFSDEVKAIEKWTKGDLSSCHGFMGKD